MLIVRDTSPIRALHHLQLLDLLPRLFKSVYLPPAVHTELLRSTSQFGSLDALAFAGFRLAAPTDLGRVQQISKLLDAGESEAIALALELSADTLLIDEFAGREIAKRMGLNVTGVLGLLVRAKANGMVPMIHPLIDRLRSEINFRLSPDVIQQALRQAGE